jgi:cytochrome c
MFKTSFFGGVAALVLIAATVLTPALAATPDEAKLLADKAAALIAAEGETAFSKLSDPAGSFVQGELYVVVMDRQGLVRANGIPKLIGMNMWEAKDPDGVLFTQEIWKAVASAETGWVTYKFTNPATRKIEPKKTWVHKVGDFVVISGAYVKE